ncbi:hypothetical protein ACFL2V_16320 [Pseudomonadota bacterium]
MSRSFEFPNQVAAHYTEDCFRYRRETSERLKAIAKFRYGQQVKSGGPLGKGFSDLIEAIEEDKLPFGNLIIPRQDVFDKLGHPFDIIGVSGIYAGSTFLFVNETTSEERTDEGQGKTGLALKLVDMPIDYDWAKKLALSFNPEVEEIQTGDPLIIGPRNGSLLLTFNMSYIGAKQVGITQDWKPAYGLHLAVSVGEMAWAMWDLARHIYRVCELESVFGPRKDAKNILQSIAANLWLDSNAFANNKVPYPINYIFIVSREGDEGIRIHTRDDQFGELKELLEGNPSYHTSRFWQISDRHNIYANELIETLTHYPRISRVNIGRNTSSEGLDLVVEQIKKEMQG